MKRSKRTHTFLTAASPSSSTMARGLLCHRFGLAIFVALSAIACSIMLLSALGPLHAPYALAEEVNDIKTVDDLAKGKTLAQLKSDEQMMNNYGTITTNDGTVVMNYGTIKSMTKSGYVKENHGSIENSLGVVLINNATIDTYHGYDQEAHLQMQANTGTINLLGSHLGYNEGTVKDAAGGWRMELNDKNATIGKMRDGFVVIDNRGTIENCISGDVQNNYGSVLKKGDMGRVHNQYYAVSATAVYTDEVPNGISIAGLDEHALEEHYGNYVKSGGKLTITPADGWYITGYGGLDGQATATLADDGLSLTLDKVTGNIAITVRLGKLYDLYVGGKEITTSNCNDIFGDGSVSYKPLTNTMFFIDAKIDAVGSGRAGLYAASGINLYFEGDCSIQGDYGHEGILVDGDVTIRESNDDFSLKVLSRDKTSSTYSETMVVYGTMRVEDGPIEIENSLSASAYEQTDGDVVIKAARDPKTGGINTSVINLSGGTFTSRGPIMPRCQLTISGADVVFDCGGAPRWCLSDSTSVTVVPPSGQVTAVIYGTSDTDSAKSEAMSITGSPFSASTNISGAVNPGNVPYSAKSSYFATKSGKQYNVKIYDGDVLRSTTGSVAGFPFSFTANIPEGYCIDTVRAQTDSGKAVTVSGPDEDGDYTLTMPKEDVAVRFAYKPITYTVTYDGNRPTGASTELTGETASQQMSYDTEYPLAESGFALNGYRFTDWNTAKDGSGTTYAAGVRVKNLASKQGAVVTLYAQWEPLTYEVTFDGNGATAGSMTPQTFTFDQSAPLKAVEFTREGHSFQCWKRSFTLGAKAYTDGETVRNLNESFNTQGEPIGVTLEAQWLDNSKVSITVLKDQQPLSGMANRISLKQGDTVFQGDGMFTESDGVYEYNPAAGAELPEEGTFSVLIDDQDTMQIIVRSDGGISKPSATVAYYSVLASAEWAPSGSNPCSIELVSGAALGEDCYVSGSVVGISVDTSGIAAGYSFDCWVPLDAAPTGDEWDPQQTQTSFTLAGMTDMIATQRANWYYVSFDANVPEGCSTELEGVMLNQKLWYDSITQLVACEYTLPGYLFTGWNTAPDGSGTRYGDEAFVENFTQEQGATVALYAQWEPIVYIVELDPNGGIGQPVSQICTFDVEAQLATAHFAKTDHHFASWNTASDGSGESFEAGATVKNLSSEQASVVTLYAQWERDEYTVVYDANEPPVVTKPVEGSMGPSTFYLGEKAALPTCAFTLEGFTFKGWNTAADGSGASYGEAEVVEPLATIPNASVMLYAQWERDPKFYRFVEGMGGTWKRDSDSPLQFKTNGAYDLFARVEVDGKEIDSESYTAWSGSTYIALQVPYLQKLASGEHTITAVYADGQCSTSFTVSDAANGGGTANGGSATNASATSASRSSTPGTGDSSSQVMGAVAMLAAAVVMALALASRRT